MALCGLPFYYDFMVQQFGWTRAQVTSGNALSKLVVGPVFGFIAGWVVDRFGPRRLMMTGVLMAGFALVGLGSISSLGMFYFFYMLDALGYVCGGPLRNQVLLSRRFDKARGKAMGFAYLGIGLGGAAAPWISHALVQHFGWQAALRTMGLLVVVIALPAASLQKTRRSRKKVAQHPTWRSRGTIFLTMPFFLLTLGSMFSIAAVSGTQQNLKLFLSLDLHFTQSQATKYLVAGIGLQHRRAFAYGLDGRLFSQEACHVIDLLVGRSCHSSIACEALASGHVRVRRGVRDWARR